MVGGYGSVMNSGWQRPSLFIRTPQKKLLHFISVANVLYGEGTCWGVCLSTLGIQET